jgi:hypothetical protein
MNRMMFKEVAWVMQDVSRFFDQLVEQQGALTQYKEPGEQRQEQQAHEASNTDGGRLAVLQHGVFDQWMVIIYIDDLRLGDFFPVWLSDYCFDGVATIVEFGGIDVWRRHCLAINLVSHFLAIDRWGYEGNIASYHGWRPAAASADSHWGGWRHTSNSYADGGKRSDTSRVFARQAIGSTRVQGSYGR